MFLNHPFRCGGEIFYSRELFGSSGDGELSFEFWIVEERLVRERFVGLAMTRSWEVPYRHVIQEGESQVK
jgi:hypothetical protein